MSENCYSFRLYGNQGLSSRRKRRSFVPGAVEKMLFHVAPWEGARLGALTVTGTPAKHAVAEVGFVVQAEGFTVYFGGDTLAIPELAEIPNRFPNIDIALVPINGLSVFGKQVAMNPVEAAQLCATLRAATAIPTHYAFNGGVTDLVMLKYYAKQDELPDLFRDALKQYAPATRLVVLQPGARFTLDSSEQCSPPANR